ncbi:hypothetical protein NLI96_g4932 [Meripilus lineatus]|uniref:Uncharacterized protein n=1 Tax=Meripilus lineatus TaxID=2056292 RepID=A0AAD5YF83_9APHY|nr:hypothetical protein NLI96_g4932 [Physisporinus lineatus]
MRLTYFTFFVLAVSGAYALASPDEPIYTIDPVEDYPTSGGTNKVFHKGNLPGGQGGIRLPGGPFSKRYIEKEDSFA